MDYGIKELKKKLIDRMAKDFGDRERIDPDMADALKDLSEADYYCTVVEQMGPSGYQMGYMHDGMRYPIGYYDPMGYQARDSRGRYMGYGDSVEAVRNILATATPEEMERIKAEVRSK